MIAVGQPSTTGIHVINHSHVLRQLLAKISPIDFRVKANLGEEQAPGNNHLQIITIEELLRVAKSEAWGICKQMEFTYVYNGAYWNSIESEKLKAFLGAVAEKLGVDPFKAKHFGFRDQLLKQFNALANLPTPARSTDSVVINLLNGTFEISKSGVVLRPFEPKDFLKYQLPFIFDPTSKCPLFEKYLNRVLPDLESQRVLAEYIGYIFLKNGVIKEEKVLFLFGGGANGKSVFHEIINALLGRENVSNYSLEDLTQESGYYRAMIANTLLNYASEMSNKVQSAVFKQLASCEPISARLPYGSPMQIVDYAKLIFNVNELPSNIEQTNAFFRRFLIIPFEMTIPPEEQDKQLHTKIIDSELSGVFNWVLDGLTRLLEQKKFSDCRASAQAQQKYRQESDSVKMFIEEENYTSSTGDSIPLKELYNSYKLYCSDNSYIRTSYRIFSERLKKEGFQILRRNYGMTIQIEKMIVL